MSLVSVSLANKVKGYRVVGEMLEALMKVIRELECGVLFSSS